ncbi:MAG: peptidase M24 [Sulfobacillus acidophilus]|uniref:Peptidase M24 n=1 Tax=Sulfobacillus acidophilus TaxID=53633 RepID=A0A2T2WLL3_9FIRM|nr:MAG: peptidase M24 [Sulfobacillus acidophilus]
MRLDRIQKQLAQRQAVLALAPGDDFRYAVGWSPKGDERPTYLIVSSRMARLVIASVNAEEAQSHLGNIVQIGRFGDDEGPEAMLREVANRLQGLPWLISDDARYGHGLLLERIIGQPLGLASEVMAPLRMQKDEDECHLLARCQEINDQAMRAAYEAMRVGMSELELADIIRRAFIANGADKEAFIIVAYGAHSAMPHHTPTTTKLGEGPVLLDIGCYYHGYASDMTRVAYLGQPTERFVEIHGLVDAAVRAAQARALPGIAAQEVDRAARQVIAAQGYGLAFVHRVGHGIGLSVHESPSVAEGNRLPLPANAAFSIEPGVYLPGEFGVRLEEVVILRPTGAQILSHVPRSVYVKPL